MVKPLLHILVVVVVVVVICIVVVVVFTLVVVDFIVVVDVSVSSSSLSSSTWRNAMVEVVPSASKDAWSSLCYIEHPKTLMPLKLQTN